MHVLVTGGHGYIGTHLVDQLVKKGHKVTVLDSHFSAKNLGILDALDIRMFRASCTNSDTVLRAMQGVDLVYHLACRKDWENSNRHPMRLSQNEVQGITTVFCMARMAGIQKVVFSSSAAIYGNLVDAKETDTPNPINMYGAMKLACEAVCRGFYNLGTETVILRFFNVWGKSGGESVIHKLLNGGKTIYHEGQQSRDFVYIDDVLTALLSAADWDSGIYNIGSGEETTVNSVWEMIKGTEKPEYIQPGPNMPAEILRSCANTEYTKYATGWEAKTLLSDLKREDIINLCKVVS